MTYSHTLKDEFNKWYEEYFSNQHKGRIEARKETLIEVKEMINTFKTHDTKVKINNKLVRKEVILKSELKQKLKNLEKKNDN